MGSPPGKTRTRAHVLADLSINHVERQVLLCGFSVNRVQHDYGYDLTMATYRDDTGEFEPGNVYIQVKATDRLPRHADGRTIPWRVSRRDLKLWLAERYPVILVVYDGPEGQGVLDSRPEVFLRPSDTRAVRRWRNDDDPYPDGESVQPAGDPGHRTR